MRRRAVYNPAVAQSVRIAGAGLSGLATALLLARAGFEVELFERRGTPGGRFFGGWQVLENGTSELDVLEELVSLGLAPGFPVRPVTRAVFVDHRGRHFEVASKLPFSYLVRRGGGDGLDTWLLARCREAGVRVFVGQEGPDDVDVVATGPRHADGVARERLFATDLRDTVMVLFDPTVTPTGYGYLFCIDGAATFGVAQVRGVRSLRRAEEVAWERFRAALGDFSVSGEEERGQFMNFSMPRTLHGPDARWYVGEAAGVQDFLFGLGNRLALRTAALAAAGLRGAFDQTTFERTVVRQMRASVALRFLYERLGRSGFTALCRNASRRDFRELLIQLQRPGVLLSLVARCVMPFWRARGGCQHAPTCSWCRRSEA